MLTWKRGKVTGNNGFGTHTTHTTTYPNGVQVTIKSVEGSFFFYRDGEQIQGVFVDTLREAKALIERDAKALVAAACLEPGNCPEVESGMPCNSCA